MKRVRVFAMAALLLLAGRAAAETRIALVVGVSTYDSPDIPALPNAVNDARAVHAELGALGFSSVLLENPDRRELRAGLSALFRRRQQSGADTALVYVAGHGVQFRNQGYVLARDSALTPGEDLEARQEVPIARLLQVVSEAKLAILLLDACRNTPAFAARLSWLSNSSVAAGLPLADTMKTDAVISYSAEPGASAIDGLGTEKHSPYAEALLDYLGRPELELTAMFQGVRRFVESETEGKQRPLFEERRSPGHPFYFHSAAAPIGGPVSTSASPLPPTGRLSGREALALLAGKTGATRGDALAGLLAGAALAPPVSARDAFALLGDVPADAGRRRRALALLLPLLETPISPAAAEQLLSGLSETGRLTALTDMVGCLARPLPEPEARRMVEGVPRPDMPRLLRQLTSAERTGSTCGSARP